MAADSRYQMLRRPPVLVGLLLLLAGGGKAAPAGASPQPAPASGAAELEGLPAPLTVPEDPTTEEKRRKEIEKLQAEIESLRLQNEALDVQTRRWSAWLGAVGGVTGALLTFVIGFLGWRLNRLQDSRARQEKHLSLRKLEQDRHLEREKQNMALYEGLGHQNPRVQFAAASVLLERLFTFQEKSREGREPTAAERAEHPTIVKVLIAVIKERVEETETHKALRKHIADNLVKALDAVVEEVEGADPPPGSSSPLLRWDWQYANLAEVWWQRVDARGVDFFQANFRNAGLAGAFLDGAVFYQADLRDAVLKGAHLEGANFYGARLDGSRLDGATFDQSTTWPEGFDPAVIQRAPT